MPMTLSREKEAHFSIRPSREALTPKLESGAATTDVGRDRCNRDDDRRSDSPLRLPHVWRQPSGRGVRYRKRNDALASNDCTAWVGTANVAMTAQRPIMIESNRAAAANTTAAAAVPAVAACCYVRGCAC